MNEPCEYRVLLPVLVNGVQAYLPGEGISLQVVEDLGLVVGEHVEPARADVIGMPALNASRADWVRYAQFQSVRDGKPSLTEIDDLTRDQLRDLYVQDEAKPAAKSAGTKSAQKEG
jgi:hypothetical protein